MNRIAVEDISNEEFNVDDPDLVFYIAVTLIRALSTSNQLHHHDDLCKISSMSNVRSFFDDVKIHDKFQFVVVCLLVRS